MKEQRKNTNRTIFLVQFSMLVAIEAVFCFTPLGSLPAIGPIVATLMMVPVVITALTMGMKAGTAMGAIAGLFSFLVWTFIPPTPIAAFIFTPFYSFGEFTGNFGSVLICFVPRIIAGTVAGASLQAFTKLWRKQRVLCYSIGGALGSLTNTLLVMSGIWLFFGEQYASIAGKSIIAVIGLTILTSGIPEAVINAVIAPAVCKALKGAFKQK